MKKQLPSLLLCTLCFLLMKPSAYAQTSKPYTEGAVWMTQFVKTKAGMGDLYLKNLSEGWIRVMEEAKKQGLIMDYKVLSTEPASPGDWNLMLLYELKNYASLDGMSDKIQAISQKLFGSEENQHQSAVSRNDLRELYGGKLMQELNFKK